MSHLNGLYPANLIDRMEAYLLSQMAAQGGIPPNLYSMHGEYNCIPPLHTLKFIESSWLASIMQVNSAPQQNVSITSSVSVHCHDNS